MNLKTDEIKMTDNQPETQRPVLNWNVSLFNGLTINELYDLIQLRNEVFVVGQNCVYQDADGMDEKAFHILGYSNNHLVAYSRIFPPDIIEPRQCNFGRVAVSPDRRREGWGRLLVQKNKDFLKEKWPESTTLIHAQLYLERFYTELGFKTCSEVYNEVGIPHIRMKWENWGQ